MFGEDAAKKMVDINTIDGFQVNILTLFLSFFLSYISKLKKKYALSKNQEVNICLCLLSLWKGKGEGCSNILMR